MNEYIFLQAGWHWMQSLAFQTAFDCVTLGGWIHFYPMKKCKEESLSIRMNQWKASWSNLFENNPNKDHLRLTWRWLAYNKVTTDVNRWNTKSNWFDIECNLEYFKTFLAFPYATYNRKKIQLHRMKYHYSKST